MGNTKILNNLKVPILLALGTTLILLGLVLFSPSRANAAIGSCSTATSDFGVATVTESEVGALANVEVDDSYAIWSRVKAPNGTPAQYSVMIDGDGSTSCYDQTLSGNSNGTGDTWVWVKTADLNWADGGNMRIQMVGTQDGMGLDCVVLRHDDVDFAATDPGADGCDPTYDPGGTDSSGDGNGCTVVSFSIAIDGIGSYRSNTVYSGLSEFDADSNGEIGFGEVIDIIGAYRAGTCVN